MKPARRNLVFFGILALILLASASWLAAQTDPPKTGGEPAKSAAPEEPKDITAQANEYNSDKYAQPPTGFRPGHVTPRKLDDKALTKTENGYVVQLPSKAPVATPSVFEDGVFVSGGFRSKEFYAFEAKTGKLRWALDLDDDGPSSAVAAEGVIIFNTESCTIFAVDAKTGRYLWSWWLGDPLMSTPTIANGRVFTSYPASGRSGAMAQQIQTSNANVIEQKAAAINTMGEQKEDKKKEGDAKIETPRPAPPATHVLAAFDLRTGKILWQRWIDSDVMSAPVAEGEELFVTTFSGTMYRFRQSDGAILSVRQVRATSAPVVVGGELFYTKRADIPSSGKVEETTVTAKKSSGEISREVNRKEAPYIDGAVQSKAAYKTTGSSLDAANGFAAGAPAQANPQAAFENIGQGNVSTLQAFQGSRVLSYGDNNYNVMGDEIVCNDRKTGDKRWTRKIPGDLRAVGGFMGTPPAAAGGFIFVGTHEGEVLQLDPADGRPVQTYKVGSAIRSQPSVDGGFIFIGTQDGKLVAIDTKNEKLTGWPMWGGDAAHTGYREPVKK